MYCLGRIYLQYRLSCYQRFSLSTRKKVLNILLEHKHPVVLFFGRAMYKRIPAEYQEAIDEGRMLIDTVRNFERHS